MEDFVQHLAVMELALMEHHGGDLGGEHQTLIAGAIDILQEDEFYAIALEIDGADELIATAERMLVVHRDARHDRVVAFGVHLREADAARNQKFMAGMFGVVLIIGIIDDVLQVALIVAHLQADRE